MNDDGGGNAGDNCTAATQVYFCYQCNHTVSIIPSPNDPFCPNCKSRFIVEYEHPNPNPNSVSQNPFLAFDDPNLLAFVKRAVSGSSVSYKMDLLPLFNSPMSRPLGAEKAGEFDPYLFLQNHVDNLLKDKAYTEIVENSEGLFLCNASKSASKSAVENLRKFKISMEEDLDSECLVCAVCTCGFEQDEEVTQFPCAHLYHSDCILQWLELNNSCPVCRLKLPTDSEDFENWFARISMEDSVSDGNTSDETSNPGTKNDTSGDGNQGTGID